MTEREHQRLMPDAPSRPSFLSDAQLAERLRDVLSDETLSLCHQLAEVSYQAGRDLGRGDAELNLAYWQAWRDGLIAALSPLSSLQELPHDAEIREHVAASLVTLNERMEAHDAVSQCGHSTACSHCQLLALSFAQIRRVLDFLEVEIPQR